MKVGIVAAVCVAAFIAILAYLTVGGRKYRVEVCVAYQGRTNCRTVSAKSKEAALRSGIENACADIASGVTDTMRCQQTQPQSVKWFATPGERQP